MGAARPLVPTETGPKQDRTRRGVRSNQLLQWGNLASEGKTGRDVSCHLLTPLLLQLSDPCPFKVGFADSFFANIYLKSRYSQEEER